MEIQAHITDLTDKINKLRPLELGDPVIHKATKLCGHVCAIESYQRVEGQIISVALFNRKTMRGISRLEFALNTPSLEQMRAHALNLQAVTTGAQEAISVALEGPVSDVSILDELC